MVLILVPGVLTQYWYERFRPIRKMPSGGEVLSVLRSLIFGWPVLVAIWLTLIWRYKVPLWDLRLLEPFLFRVDTYAVYLVALILLSPLAVGAYVLWAKVSDWALSHLGHSALLEAQPWDDMFWLRCDKPVLERATKKALPDASGWHAVRIVRAGQKPIEGFVKHASVSVEGERSSLGRRVSGFGQRPVRPFLLYHGCVGLPTKPTTALRLTLKPLFARFWGPLSLPNPSARAIRGTDCGLVLRYQL